MITQVWIRPCCLLLLASMPWFNVAHALSPGAPAPDFIIKDFFDDREIHLADFPDEVIYLDFWASWCGPCLRSFPFMNQLQSKYADQGLVVIGINLDEDPKDAYRFIARQTPRFIIGTDQHADVAKSYKVTAMPSSYLIDRQGVLRIVHKGFKQSDRDKIIQLVDLLVNQQPAEAATEPEAPVSSQVTPPSPGAGSKQVPPTNVKPRAKQSIWARLF